MLFSYFEQTCKAVQVKLLNSLAFLSNRDKYLNAFYLGANQASESIKIITIINNTEDHSSFQKNHSSMDPTTAIANKTESNHSNRKFQIRILIYVRGQISPRVIGSTI